MINLTLVDLSTSQCQTKGCGYSSHFLDVPPFASPETLGPTQIDAEIKTRANKRQ